MQKIENLERLINYLQEDSVVNACKRANIDTRTYYRWLYFAEDEEKVKKYPLLNNLKETLKHRMAGTNRYNGQIIKGNYKLCSGIDGCKEWKPLDAFYKKPRKTGGFTYYSLCTPCRNDRRRYTQYGLNKGEYDIMLEEQKNRCAVCRTDMPGQGKSWSVDHNHDTEQIRGLLCHHCNVKLVSAMDYMLENDLLERVYSYCAESSKGNTPYLPIQVVIDRNNRIIENIIEEWK